MALALLSLLTKAYHTLTNISPYSQHKNQQKSEISKFRLRKDIRRDNNILNVVDEIIQTGNQKLETDIVSYRKEPFVV